MVFFEVAIIQNESTDILRITSIATMNATFEPIFKREKNFMQFTFFLTLPYIDITNYPKNKSKMQSKYAKFIFIKKISNVSYNHHLIYLIC